MPDFYEYLQRPLGGGGDLLTVPRGVYHLPRRPLLLSDWSPFTPALQALPPSHFYYGYYATAAAGLVSSYLRESQTTTPTSSSVSSWVEQRTPLPRRLHARRRPLQLHDVPTSASNVAGAPPDAATTAAAAAASMKCLSRAKRTMKANERWAAINKQTYQKIVDATLEEMTSHSEDAPRDDDEDDDLPEVGHKRNLAGKGPLQSLQLARSITPIFRRSPGVSRGREGMLRRHHKVIAQPEVKVTCSPLAVKSRSQEIPLDLSTHSSGRAATELLGLMVCQSQSREQNSALQQPPRGPSVQTLHNWQNVQESVRRSAVLTDPGDAATIPRAVWLRAQPSAHSGSTECQAVQIVSSAPANAGEGRIEQSSTTSSESESHTLDATPLLGASVPGQPEEMSSGVAMSRHGGLRSQEDLWVPLNKDTVLGVVNDVVDSMVPTDLSDRYPGQQRGSSRTSECERTSGTPPSPRIHRGTRRPTQTCPAPAKHSSVMENSPTSLSCPSKSTSQKENLHSTSRGRRPSSPAKGQGRGENMDRWVAINKIAMRDIVENAIRCELEGEDTGTTPSDDRVDAPEACATKSKTEGPQNEVDYNANERLQETSSSQGQGSGRATHKRSRSPSPSEGKKRTKGEESCRKSPPSPVEAAKSPRSPQPEKAGDRATPDSKEGEFSHPKGVKVPQRASPTCMGQRRLPRALDSPLRPPSLPPVPLEIKDKRHSHSSHPGPLTVHDAPNTKRNTCMTAWVAVSKNMVNSMIEDILVDKVEAASSSGVTVSKTGVTSSKTKVNDSTSTMSKTSDAASKASSGDTSQGRGETSKTPDLRVSPTSGSGSSDKSKSEKSEKCENMDKLERNDKFENTPSSVVPPSSSSEQEQQRCSTPRSPVSSPETVTTDSTSSSDHVASNNAVCKSGFKLKSAMLERFNEERKSSTSSPSPVTSSQSPSVTSSHSPVTSSSPSVTPSPSPTSPATSKISKTFSVVCDQEGAKKLPQPLPQSSATPPVIAQKGKSKKAHKSRPTCKD